MADQWLAAAWYSIPQTQLAPLSELGFTYIICQMTEKSCFLSPPSGIPSLRGLFDTSRRPSAWFERLGNLSGVTVFELAQAFLIDVFAH